MASLRQAVVSFLRGWMPPPSEGGPWWMEGAAWRAALDTGFAKPAHIHTAPDFLFLHRGRLLAINLLEPDEEIPPGQELTNTAIWDAGGIPATCRALEDVAVVLEAFGVRTHASLDHRVEAAALQIQ
jgi:hypothetical protein